MGVLDGELATLISFADKLPFFHIDTQFFLDIIEFYLKTSYHPGDYKVCTHFV